MIITSVDLAEMTRIQNRQTICVTFLALSVPALILCGCRAAISGETIFALLACGFGILAFVMWARLRRLDRQWKAVFQTIRQRGA